MGNMSYCRFQNTRGDLQDCLDAMREEDNLSTDEREDAVGMWDDIQEFMGEYGITDMAGMRAHIESMPKEFDDDE